jgi:hypothetical protein
MAILATAGEGPRGGKRRPRRCARVIARPLALHAVAPASGAPAMSSCRPASRASPSSCMALAMGDQHRLAEAHGDRRGGLAHMDHERAAAARCRRHTSEWCRGNASRHRRLVGGRRLIAGQIRRSIASPSPSQPGPFGKTIVPVEARMPPRPCVASASTEVSENYDSAVKQLTPKIRSRCYVPPRSSILQLDRVGMRGSHDNQTDPSNPFP